MQDLPSRRRFLELLGAGSCLGLTACGSGEEDTPNAPAGMAGGNIDDLPSGTLRVLTGFSAYIGRDDDGVYALSSICTHQGCDMTKQGSVSATQISCNCHGSRYDANGEVTSGPAVATLTHYEVEIDADGEITVHGDKKVPAETRLAVTG